MDGRERRDATGQDRTWQDKAWQGIRAGKIASKKAQVTIALTAMTTFDPQGRTGFGLHVFVLRFYRLGLTQAQFAERFGISLGCVRDIEQNRTRSAARSEEHTSELQSLM